MLKSDVELKLAMTFKPSMLSGVISGKIIIRFFITLKGISKNLCSHLGI